MQIFTITEVCAFDGNILDLWIWSTQQSQTQIKLHAGSYNITEW